MATNGRGGNYISEWYGQRIYPVVRLNVNAVVGPEAGSCPFLSDVLHKRTLCVKPANSNGVCTISSVSNGPRQDWLVCPYRVIDSDIVSSGCQLIFGLEQPVEPLPVSILADPGELTAFVDGVNRNGVGYLFFQNKLGGEISVVSTRRSPELSFDVTLVEIRPDGAGAFNVSRYGILEIQTMDYHGTYMHAVNNLRDGLRLHGDSFAATLAANLDRWAGERVEGPNIANVFKRTFYQMLLKFRLSGDGSAAAGSVLAIPRAVWDSWQPFLGAPELEAESPGIKRLKVAAGAGSEPPLNSFICVFDLDATNVAAISPIRIEHYIRVSPERMTHHAFTEVPSHMLRSIQSDESILATIRSRLAEWWPAFQMRGARRPRRQP